MTILEYIDNTKNEDDESSYLHRMMVGFIGLLLPIGTLTMVTLRSEPEVPTFPTLDSVSAYYYTSASPVFVGSLIALGICLLTYAGYNNGRQKYDWWVSRIGGVSAILIALFPTTPRSNVSPPWWQSWISVVHYTAAIVLFCCFAVFALWLFRGSNEAVQAQTTRLQTSEWFTKQRRNFTYTVCGIGILLSMIACLWLQLNSCSIFYPECAAIIFFAIAWLVKGRAYKVPRAVYQKARGRW